MHYEEVNGTVIGACLPIYVKLFTPSGAPFRNGKSFASEQDAESWANTTRDKAIQDIGRAESRALGWDKPWQLKFYR